MAASITGLEELNRAFKALDADLKTKVGRKMVASAAGVVKKEAKRIALSKGLKKTGALVANIVTKREKQTPNDTIQYNVGVRHGRALGNGKKVIKYLALSKRGRVITKRKNDPFYWHFLEFGTKYIEPMRFIEPALDNKQQEAITAMSKTLDKELLKGRK